MFNKERSVNHTSSNQNEVKVEKRLWYEGANLTADAIVTKINEDGSLEMIAILRDNGQWAIPGGFKNKGENGFDACARELEEETSTRLDFRNSILVHDDLVDDPRNEYPERYIKDEARHIHLESSQSNSIKLKAEDDARDVKWMVCSQANIDSLYASHPFLVKKTISIFQEQHNCQVLENGKVVFN